MDNPLRSYPKVFAIGHRAIKGLFNNSVVVQEKVDGSQFSFGVVDGQLYCRSKNANQPLNTPDNLFEGAVETAMRLWDEGKLEEGWVYRGEALRAPKHNTLEYSRVPEGNIILFDIDVGIEHRLHHESLQEEAERLGLDYVPTLYEGEVNNPDDLRELLDRESVLGGVKVEGIVVKNYHVWGHDGKMLMGKYVSEAFKEKHNKDWKKRNKSRTDIIEGIKETYRTEARWEKAVQHLREDGRLEGEPRDIGNLIKEVQQDVLEECREEIAEQLFEHFWNDIRKGLTWGLPEWYKEKLLEDSFVDTDGGIYE